MSFTSEKMEILSCLASKWEGKCGLSDQREVKKDLHEGRSKFRKDERVDIVLCASMVGPHEKKKRATGEQGERGAIGI